MTASTPPTVSDAMREAVAREIDPDAVSHGDVAYRGGDYTKIAFSNRKRAALKAADAILAGPIASALAALEREARLLAAEAARRGREIEYTAARRNLWLNEAQRLAALVRELGGNPEPDAHAALSSPEQTDGR